MSRRRPRPPWEHRSLRGIPAGSPSRLQAPVRNTRDPSARPLSSRRGARISRRRSRGVRSGSPRGSSYRRSRRRTTPREGRVPGVEASSERGSGAAMATRASLTTPGGQVPREKVRQLQRRPWAAAKRSPGRRFHALYDHLWRGDVLLEAWKRVRANEGEAGVDAETLSGVERYGVERFLEELGEVLRTRRYRAGVVLRRYIPKRDGRRRPLGIPTVGTGWSRWRRSWCWSRSSRRTFCPSRTVFGLGGARRIPWRR